MSTFFTMAGSHYILITRVNMLLPMRKLVVLLAFGVIVPSVICGPGRMRIVCADGAGCCSHEYRSAPTGGSDHHTLCGGPYAHSCPNGRTLAHT